MKGFTLFPLAALVLALPFTAVFAAGKSSAASSSASSAISSSPATNDTNSAAISNTLPEGFSLVEAGRFQMGDTWGGGLDNELPVHAVELTSYLISKTEITQRDYFLVMKTNPSRFRGDLLPVEQVSWLDAVRYCNQRSKLEKLKPCYTLVTNADALDFGDWNVSCDFTASGYRLPTEAEWEFAARGGNATRGWKYAGSWRAEDTAWFDTNALSSTHSAARKATNELGIFDMCGNVREWVWDWYAPYADGYVKNPYGPYIGRIQPDRADSPLAKTVRGGAWLDEEAPGDLGVRLSRRSPMEPEAADDTTGLRVVRLP